MNDCTRRHDVEHALGRDVSDKRRNTVLQLHAVRGQLLAADFATWIIRNVFYQLSIFMLNERGINLEREFLVGHHRAHEGPEHLLDELTRDNPQVRLEEANHLTSVSNHRFDGYF